MKHLTKEEYYAIHPDYRSVWTAERTDWPDWEEKKKFYMGKRTMMENQGGETTLLIEGIHFIITE